MFKKSVIIVIIQLFGSVLGLLSIYFIAGDMEPSVYSLIGIYTVISGILLTFSQLGIETTMTREALFWVEHGNIEKVKEYASQAFISRFIALLILCPFILAYVIVINETKYEGDYTVLLIAFIVGASINSINNAMILMVQSLGGYVFAQIASTVNNYVLKFSGLALYFWKGADVYLWFYGLSSIPLAIVYYIKLRRYLNFSYFKLKPTIRKIVEGRYLWLKSDLDYFKNNADSVLVSALFPVGVMGSYTIFKHIEQLAKGLIEGFFDVLSQNTVKYKGNENKLREHEKKIKMASKAIMAFILLFVAIFSLDSNFFIQLVNLSKYEYIDLMMYCVAMSSLFYLMGKYEINAIAFFGTSKMNFMIGVTLFVISCLSYIVVIAMPTIYGILAQRIFIYIVVSAISMYLFKKHRKELYTKVLK